MIHNVRRKNKGFSMVELIIVIAIMAVLAGVLAPLLIKYIEKSRRTKDVSAANEIKSAFERAVMNNAIDDNGSAVAQTASVTIPTSYDYDNPPYDIVEAAFMELGCVPVPSTNENYEWYIIYSPKDNSVTKIYLTDPTDSSVKYELFPDSSKFSAMED